MGDLIMEENNVQAVQDKTTEVVSIGQWIGLFILLAIPIVGFIVWIVKLASSNTNKNVKNMLIAGLIVGAIVTVLMFVFGGAIMAIVYNNLGNMNVYY